MVATPTSTGTGQDEVTGDPHGVGDGTAEPVPVNHVRVVAKVTTVPERQQLPSGDEVVSFGVSVPRPGGGSDAIPVQAGPAPGPGRRPAAGQVGRRLLADVERLEAGDWVSIEGRLRRRWWDAGGARRSRIEVAVASCVVVG